MGRITEDDEALLPALILWPSTSSHLLLTPPLPAPHSKFSLCSFTIRSVRSQPACRAQGSMDATITHSLSNSDAKSVPTVGGRRLHFKCCSIRKKKHNTLPVIQIELHLYYFWYIGMHANVFCRFNSKTEPLRFFSMKLAATHCGLNPKTAAQRYTHVNAIRPVVYSH